MPDSDEMKIWVGMSGKPYSEIKKKAVLVMPFKVQMPFCLLSSDFCLLSAECSLHRCGFRTCLDIRQNELPQLPPLHLAIIAGSTVVNTTIDTTLRCLFCSMIK